MVHTSLLPSSVRGKGDNQFSTASSAGVSNALIGSQSIPPSDGFILKYGQGVLGTDICYPISGQVTDNWLDMTSVSTLTKQLTCPTSFGKPSSVLVDFIAHRGGGGSFSAIVNLDIGSTPLSGKTMSLIVNEDYTKSMSMQTISENMGPNEVPLNWNDVLGKNYTELGGYILGMYQTTASFPRAIAWANVIASPAVLNAYIEGAWIDNSGPNCVINIKFVKVTGGNNNPQTYFRAVIKKIPSL